MIVTNILRGPANSQQKATWQQEICYPSMATLLNRGTGTVTMATAEVLSPVSDGATSQLQLPVSGPEDLAQMIFQSDQPLHITIILTW